MELGLGGWGFNCGFERGFQSRVEGGSVGLKGGFNRGSQIFRSWPSSSWVHGQAASELRSG